MNELPTRYDPKATEADIYGRWMAADCFRATPDGREKRYCITIPPPNITGALHLGHALNNTIMDVLGRWKRMLGYNTLILPGTDHGGISTQSVVEKQIAREGLSRYDLGREAFVGRVNQWADEYGDTILSQLRRLGCAYDWSRTRYTLDEGYTDAILTVFERLYERGDIYLGYRIVNWCPFHRTAISDIEVEHEEDQGLLYYIRYPFTDGSGDVTVATTRPETMLGDTAVAVNPKDPRYKEQVGKDLILPLMGRTIPLIADDFAQMEFGTGAVKVTPAHDPNDYEAGVRNHLPFVIVIGPDGSMNENAGKYAGLDRFEARKRVLADLEAQGFLVKTEPHTKSVGRCDRCKSVIEPLLSRQWFCRMGGTPMVEKAIRAAATDDVRFVPPRYKDIYLRWMENIRDWPISRQLWWGHRMPLWRRLDGDPDEQSSYVVARTREEATRKAGTDAVEQIEDVLDTWFSSALWPFATLGWPQESPDLAYYYPTDGLFTAQEILYLWVARMIMSSLRLTGEVPFRQVVIHGLVRDEHGNKMSKSKGNVMDPLILIDELGCDAVRFTMTAMSGQARDIKLSKQRIEGYRNFGTKLWNASRFAQMNECVRVEGFDPSTVRQPINKWIRGETVKTAAEVTRALEAPAFSDAADALYKFIWNVFCDWYLELAKPILNGDDAEAKAETRATAAWALDVILKLLHPVMPFITEELWDKTAEFGAPRQGMLIVEKWPELPDAWIDADAEAEIGWLVETVGEIRSIRAEMNVPPGAKPPLSVIGAGPETKARLARHRDLLLSLARLDSAREAETAPAGSVPIVLGEATGALAIAEFIDLTAEKARLAKEIAGHVGEIEKTGKKLSNPDFLARAKEEVVEENRERLAEAEAAKAKLEAALARLEAVG
jgi:valyl-tRNA synthetase